MSDLNQYIKKQLKNPEFKKEYYDSSLEYELIKAIIAARIESNMTQKQLAEKSGIRQSNISRIENGTCVPSLTTLQALADGLGKKWTFKLQ